MHLRVSPADRLRPSGYHGIVFSLVLLFKPASAGFFCHAFQAAPIPLTRPAPGAQSSTDWKRLGNALPGRVDFRYACEMLSLVLSTIAFFVASFFTKRWLDDMGIPKTMTRSIVIFVAAAVVSYGVAVVVEMVIA